MIIDIKSEKGKGIPPCEDSPPHVRRHSVHHGRPDRFAELHSGQRGYRKAGKIYEGKAAEEFIYWLFSSEKGKEFVINKLDLIAPFDTFSENEVPEDPLAQEVINCAVFITIKLLYFTITIS